MHRGTISPECPVVRKPHLSLRGDDDRRGTVCALHRCVVGTGLGLEVYLLPEPPGDLTSCAAPVALMPLAGCAA